MFYIHVHRDDQPPPARYIGASPIATAPHANASANTGSVKLASHQVDADASNSHVLIILDNSRPSSDPIVLRFQDSESGEDPQIYTLQVVDSHEAELAVRR